ncbi:replication initiation and membrane attachment family protein [Lacticaseibacillus baoqingensis]|uniref:Replication initiation and membrane attachment family protein n=1 Tax=Lacticaseibacillus baoqingensis TaxID=2486013 RepID=A0ABW4E3P7_9LACO|nr:replication initiation protein [Lacticaseibacillus baoqingensis]
MERPQSFMAQDDYIVTQATYFTDHDQQVAVALYQPLVGPVALALYLSLWQEAAPRPVLTDRRSQTRLLDLLNINVETLYQARIKLEAVGLLKTYTATDAISRYYAYELYAPVTPPEFFADDLLGMLLYDRVGQSRYDELAQQFTLHPVRREDWQDVSQNFLSVFELTNVLDQPAAVAKAQRQLAQKPHPEVSLGTGDGYDWVLLTQLTQRTNLKAGAIDANREALYQVARFYGLNPPQLATLITAATDVMTGELHLKQLREFAEQKYSQPQKAAFTTGRQSPPAASEPAKPALALTPAETALLKKATSMAPRAFLEAAKKAKNARAFAAPNETYAVRDLVQRRTFPEATVNILVDYVLRSYDSLSQALLNGYVSRWVNANVDSPQSALAQIRKETQAKAKPRANSQRPSRQEETPAWMQPGYTPKTQPVSAERKDKIAARLAKLKALEEGGRQE